MQAISFPTGHMLSALTAALRRAFTVSAPADAAGRPRKEAAAPSALYTGIDRVDAITLTELSALAAKGLREYTDETGACYVDNGRGRLIRYDSVVYEE